MPNNSPDQKEVVLDIPKEQEEQTLKDREAIDRMYEYRATQEDKWLKYAAKWNQLIEGDDIETGIAHFNVPISRMATHTGIVAMRQDLPDLILKPEGRDDRKKAELIRDASAHIDKMCNMESHMDQMIIGYSVLGNGVLEDYMQVPFKTRKRIKLDKNGKPTSKFTWTTRRDWSRSKIGTRSRSIWECAFDHRARTVAEIKMCTFQDKISYPEFKTQYMSGMDSAPDYINTDKVEPGVVYMFGDKGNWERDVRDDDMVILDTFQDEDSDSHRLYANGVLIWDVPLSSLHRHGKITLSLIPNHHKFDNNLKTSCLYGSGDPELLEEIDDLVNAMTNQFITNMASKNTYVVGVEGGNVEEYDIESGDVITGRVNVQSMGAADINEWNSFKEVVEEWGIQVTKKNWKRIQADTAQTAFEAMQKQQNEDQGMRYQIKVMEAGGLYNHFYKRIYDIMEHMTVEETEALQEEEIKSISEFIDQGGTAPEDVVLDTKTGKPAKIKYTEKFTTRGSVYEEVFINGKRHIDSLRHVKELDGEDGTMVAAREYLWTMEYITRGMIPDFYVIGKSMEGRDRNMELQQMERFLGMVVTLKQLNPEMAIKFEGILERAVDSLDIMKREELMDVSDDDESTVEFKEGIQALEETLKGDISVPQLTDVPTQEANIGDALSVGEGQATIPELQ